MQLYLNGRAATLDDFIDDDLARAVYNSLFSWARAKDDDDLPGNSRYGWWGDTFADETDDHFGSRLWLLMRAKMTDENLAKAEEYANEALQWLIDDGVATAVTVKAEKGGQERLDLAIEITKPNDDIATTARFQDVWGN